MTTKSETPTRDIFPYFRIGEVYPKGATPHQLYALKDRAKRLALFSEVINDLFDRGWSFNQSQLW